VAESRFYNALTAQAFCELGRFTVYGFTLKPFSLLHSAQLDALESPLWTAGGDVGPEDVMAAAQICASDRPVVEFAPAVSGYDENEQLHRWLEYMKICVSRPMLKQPSSEREGVGLSAPVELIVASYIMANSTITEERVWTMPYGLACWYFESIREQKDGESMILSEQLAAELDRMNTEQAIAERKEKETRARWIIENIKEPKRRFELLEANINGQLPEDWQHT
jgi:hypothetical protein